MRIKLFPFQEKAVEDLRKRSDFAIKAYRETQEPQVVSFQAPTGSGKTVMMTTFIERVLFGDERRDETPNAVFVWLSDSPQLNLQSKEKIDTQSDKMRYGQTVIVDEASFDREVFEDGHVYFINTQKLSRSGNLGRQHDGREYTIWQTIENTLEQKADRLYFIIDEAHRGMQGAEGGRQTAIMQRFLRGWREVGLKPMPVVIGMSATADRFNQLVASISSTCQYVKIAADEVRRSGLLKERIIVKYPSDTENHDPMAILTAAARDWREKCDVWREYCNGQNIPDVKPVFVVQVKSGSEANAISDTDLGVAVEKIERAADCHFQEGEVVHTFGGTGDIEIGGYRIGKVAPSDIAGDCNIRVVFFKENLSTGWDCPRAETMMSFCVAQDATYIAQLLGRMIRTPLQRHVPSYEELNNVKLFLPNFNRDNVQGVIEELNASQSGSMPVSVDLDAIMSDAFVPWGATRRIRREVEDPHQMKLFVDLPSYEPAHTEEMAVHPQSEPIPEPVKVVKEEVEKEKFVQPKLTLEIDRRDIIRRINQMDIRSYDVRVGVHHVRNYLSSLQRMSSLLTTSGIHIRANEEVRKALTDMIHDAIGEMKKSGRYDELDRAISNLALAGTAYDAFGKRVSLGTQTEFVFVTEDEIDRRAREADVALGRFGLLNEYGRRFGEEDYKRDCIIFASDDACMRKIEEYAKGAFIDYDNKYRRYLSSADDRTREEYEQIAESSGVNVQRRLQLPETIDGFSSEDGEEFQNHLYADENGIARIRLDSNWERDLIRKEEEGRDFVCWLRNRAKAKWALAIPYDDKGETKPFYPDFLIVRRDDSEFCKLGYVVDVLEPHRPDLTDNLPKAKGLAKYAKEERRLGRIQLIRQVKSLGGKLVFQRLDMSNGDVRQKVLNACNDEELCHIFETEAIVDGQDESAKMPKKVEIDGGQSHATKEDISNLSGQLRKIKNDTSLLVRVMEAEPELKISGGKLQNWKDLLDYMNRHTDRDVYTLPHCCEHSFQNYDGGFSSWTALRSYAYEHRSALPA